jgi:hypothetical protein
VFAIVANASDHRGEKAVDRLRRVFFSVIQKKAISPNNFRSLDELPETLLAFTKRYIGLRSRLTGNTPSTTSVTCSAA